MDALSKKYKCPSCSREYVRKPYYDKHILCCGFLNKSKYERERELEEYDDTPSVRQLYLLVQDLSARYQKQAKELNELKQYVKKTKKKIDIIEWLNKTYSAPDFHCFVESISISDVHLETIFENNLIDGFISVIQEMIGACPDMPLRCFDCNPGCFFVHISASWIMLTAIEFEKMVATVHSKILLAFRAWQKKNMDKIIQDKFKDNFYHHCVLKIMGGRLSKQDLQLRIKNKLFRYYKSDLKSVTEYEFS